MVLGLWLVGRSAALADFGQTLANALLHAAVCGGDFLVWGAILRQVPRRAWVQNDGWQTYWTGHLAN